MSLSSLVHYYSATLDFMQFLKCVHLFSSLRLLFPLAGVIFPFIFSGWILGSKNLTYHFLRTALPFGSSIRKQVFSGSSLLNVYTNVCYLAVYFALLFSLEKRESCPICFYSLVPVGTHSEFVNSTA